MVKSGKTLLLSIMMGMSIMAYADESGWHFKQGQVDPNYAFHMRFPGVFHEDVLPGQLKAIELTPADKMQAQSWGLSADQEKRYLSVMSNLGAHYFKAHSLKTPFGAMLVSNDYTPVQVLGMESDSDAKRQGYAQKQAEQEFQFLGKTLTYNAAYEQAAKRLKAQMHLPIVRDFNKAPFSPYNYQPVVLKGGDELMLFVHANDEVRPIVSSLMASIQKTKGISLNVYFEDASNKDIQDWARHQAIPRKLVQSGRITLNHGSGRFASLSHGKKSQRTPTLILVSDGNSRFVDIGRF